MQLVDLIAGDDRVPGVVAPLVAHDDVAALGEEVDHLPLALVAPLGADDDRRGPTTLPGQVVELGVAAPEGELHPVRGAVAVLGDVDLGDALLLGVVVVVVVAVEHQHQVGVLLDGARLAQVRQHRPLVRAGVRGPVELRDADDGHRQVAGEHLEAARDGGDLLDAVLVPHPAAALHELDVVDDQQVQPLAALQAARLGAHLADRHALGVVDEQAGGRQPVGGPADARPVLGGEAAGPDAPGVHDGRRGQQALDELVAAHLEAEDRDRALLAQGRMLGDAEGQGRLAHAGARGHHDHVAGLEPADDPVEVEEAGGDAGHPAPALLGRGEPLDALDHQLVRAGEVAAHALLREPVDQRLGVLEHGGGLALALVDHRLDLLAHVQQPPLGRRVADHLGVGPVAGGDEGRLHEVEHAPAAARVVQPPSLVSRSITVIGSTGSPVLKRPSIARNTARWPSR